MTVGRAVPGLGQKLSIPLQQTLHIHFRVAAIWEAAGV
jgi:hypothetical protein